MSGEWGVAQIGRLTLRETYQATRKSNQNTGALTLELSGQESCPPLARTEWQARTDDIMNSIGMLVPVSFTNMAENNGYYVVIDGGADITEWTRTSDPAGREGGYTAWTLRLDKVGSDSQVDLESRLSAPGRANDYSQSGKRWHCPAGNAYGYTTGPNAPSGTVTRDSDDGDLSVYLDVPSTTSPRWSALLADYPKGRTRITVDSLERSGINASISGSAWQISNGLVRVGPDTGGTLNLSAHASAGWTTGKVWNVSRGGSASPVIGPFEAVSILRNDYEAATVRLVDTRAPGRNLLDLTLRRGSRFVEGYLQTDVSSTLGVSLAVGESGTAPASAGYVVASANDAEHHKAICGSARSFTANAGATGFYKTSVVALDFWLGVVVEGSLAQTGDQAADLQAQYIGAMAETTMAARR